ncbi:hypothetical protein FDI40_gp014 [Agrobacterium phage Atu_ph07]|uniref:Uncharacterized protein n=1 Tax=Agrobacterium phage Atu_ph07 TaxID=2024264 RepID=A0A2L0UZ61_9CAUD|nr:hypothetical protein FDI40_gp014 [Agrobacterium phage Atu_ph07]AUZ94826.1 hypothetical protein [Agrobacterium phage Atu_ph07]
MNAIYKDIGKVLASFVDDDKIPPSSIFAVSRNLYFDQYVYSMIFQPTMSSFLFYEDRLEKIKQVLRPYDLRVVSNKQTRFIYVYGKYPRDMEFALDTVTGFHLKEITLIRQDYIGKRKIEKSKPEIYYNKYHYRIKVRGTLIQDNPDLCDKLKEAISDIKITCRLKPYHGHQAVDAYYNSTYIYLTEEVDAVTASMILSSYVDRITSK